MAKRECGNCRFFEKSGIGASGHCRNDRCKDIVGIALVRKYELACRVGWDQDYYEPLAGTVPLIPGEDRPRLDAMRPRGYQGTRPDDMVVAVEQTRPVKNETSPTTTQPSSRSRQSHVGEAHRRALERKQIAQQNGVPLPPRRIEGVVATSTPQTTVPNTTEEWGKAAAESVSRPRHADESLPPTARPTVVMSSVDVNAETAALPLTPSVSASSPYGEREDTALVSFPVVPRDAEAEWERPTLVPPGLPTIAQASPSPQADSSATPIDVRDTLSAVSNGPQTRYPLPDGVAPDSLQAEWYLAERRRNQGKRCGNCRDFRPAETGDRGYCRNRFAFPAPQLVNPHDLACLSSLGTWWAASDRWWLHHAQMLPQDNPTPQADRILDEMRAQEDREQPERHPHTG